MPSNPIHAEPVALVTGGARRIGAAIVRALHAEGMKVVVHFRASASEARALEAELENTRAGSVVLASGDLCDAATPSALIQTATRHSAGWIFLLIMRRAFTRHRSAKRPPPNLMI